MTGSMLSASASRLRPRKRRTIKPKRNAGTAGIHTPAAVEADGAELDAIVFGAGLIAILERRVGARVIAVRLAQRRLLNERADPDRIRLAQRLEEALGLAHSRQCLRIAQMRMHVHETDLAPEERRAFRALKEPLRTAVIRSSADRTTECHPGRAGAHP